jgi:protein gp37
MGENSKIPWTHHTFNTWRGCNHESDGCLNCYAEAGSKRNPKVLGQWGPEGQRILCADAYWHKPFRWATDAFEARERRRVFAHSISDVFEHYDRPLFTPDGIPASLSMHGARRRLMDTILATPALDWLLLTKRPRIAVDWLQRWVKYMTCTLPVNLWLGVSVENRREGLPRIDVIRDFPAALRFLSIEPLLEDLGRVNLRGIDWVIIGGESGPRARPCNLSWIRGLVQQCRKAEVPVFVKQWGSHPILNRGEVFDALTTTRCAATEDSGPHGPWSACLEDSKGEDPSEWPLDLRQAQEFPISPLATFGVPLS